MNRASEQDVEVLVSASQRYVAEYPRAQDWADSEFGWILALPSATIGAVGRHLAMDWIESLGLEVHQESVDHQIYLVVRGKRIQLKFSTLWVNGEYVFQQIRDNDYDYLLCLGISPTDFHAWLIPKDELFIHLRGRAGQHTGASAVETYWLRGLPDHGERWLDDYGDQLSYVRHQLQSFI